MNYPVHSNLDGDFDKLMDFPAYYIFYIALEGVMRRAGLNSRGTIFSKSGQFVCFADDMDIIARTFGTVEELFTRLKREAAKVGLVVNASKTKYMLVGGTEHDRIRLCIDRRG